MAPYPYTSLTPKRPRPNSWIHQSVRPKTQYEAYRESYYSKSIPKKADPRTDRTSINIKNAFAKSYWTQPSTPGTLTLSTKRIKDKIAPQVKKDVLRSLRPKSTVKKTLSSKPRWTRNQVDHKKKKKQFIVANWGGLGLGNGLALGLTGTPTATYDAGLGAGYGTGLSTGLNTGLTANYGTNYGAGLGTMLATGTNVLGSDGVLNTRQNFGTNYETSNSQSSAGLSDISAAGLNSLTSPAGLNYLSNLAGGGGGGVSDLNSMNSISQYQNNDLDILGNNANTNNGLGGLDSLTGGTTQSQQQYAGNNNLQNSLEGKLSVGGGGRQGIGGCKF